MAKSFTYKLFTNHSPGAVVSAAGHVGLAGWLLFGGAFSPKTLPQPLTDVALISTAEFERLTQESAPTPQAPKTPVAPEIFTPELEAKSEDFTVKPADPPVETTPPEPKFESVSEPAGAPDLQPSDTPQERQADRIASQITAPPDRQAPSDPVTDEVVALTSRPVIEPPQPQEQPKPVAAPEASATRVITPDETSAGGLETSTRPPLRPASLERSVVEDKKEDDTPQENSQDDAISAALAAASAAVSSISSAPQGPPLSGSETDGFRSAVGKCWNVDNGAQSANVRVDVRFELTREGRVSGDVSLLLASGGSDAAQRAAFQAARRAILRCSRSGYNLPPDKYDHWKVVELTFDPSQMRVR